LGVVFGGEGMQDADAEIESIQDEVATHDHHEQHIPDHIQPHDVLPNRKRRDNSGRTQAGADISAGRSVRGGRLRKISRKVSGNGSSSDDSSSGSGPFWMLPLSR